MQAFIALSLTHLLGGDLHQIRARDRGFQAAKLLGELARQP